MSDSSNKENANLPLAVFGALLQTGAGMALIGTAAVGTAAMAAPVPGSSASLPDNGLQAPELVLQSDGTVVPQSSLQQIAAQSASRQNAQTKGICFTLSEDGTISLEEIEEADTTRPVTPSASQSNIAECPPEVVAEDPIYS